ncbi:MAG: hypothetical protein ACJAYY_002819 [Paraglaciecola sp.]|jgi:hypothetical protein
MERITAIYLKEFQHIIDTKKAAKKKLFKVSAIQK